MDLSYFQKINNTYQSQSSQETDLFLLNRHVDECFADTIDYHKVKKNGEPFELIIVKDTDGNTFKKKIKSKHSTPFNLGDYIEWNNQIWMVTLLDTDEKTYHCGYMYLCTILLRWQNSSGEILERWAYAEDYTKYSAGVTGNSTITVGDYQYGITLPSDVETRKLKREVRFVIDYEGNYPPDVYRLTSKKAYLNDDNYFDRGGVITFTLSYDFFNNEEDKLITLEDGSQVWICDYHSPTTPSEPITPPDETAIFSAVIIGNKSLKLGFPRTYSVSFADKNGNSIEVADSDFKWNIVSDFEVGNTINGKTIELYVDDENYLSSSFLLQILDVNDAVVSSVEITVIEGF